MNNSIYIIYYKTRKIIERIELLQNKEDPEYERLDSWKTSLEILELSNGDYKTRYEQDKAIQESFTHEQIDFICYQIGDWYLKWKKSIIVDGEKCEHRLGFAKEELKTMICGI